MGATDVEVDQRRAEALVAKQLTDRQEIHARLEESRGEGVAERVRRDPLPDTRLARRRLAGLLDRGRAERDARRLAGE